MRLITLGAVALCLLVVVVIARAAGAGTPRQSRKRVALVTAFGLSAWLAIIGGIAATGFFARFSESSPPRLLLVVIGAVALFAVTLRTTTATRIIHALPLALPIAVQAFRIVVEIGLWALYEQGQLPKHLTFEGRNFDVLVGLTAPFVALALHRAWIAPRLAVLWNIASLGVLANIVIMAITSIPGPLHYSGWSDSRPNTIVADFPFVWLPGFLVPVALFGHVVSLRQLLAMDAKNSAFNHAEPLERRRGHSIDRKPPQAAGE